MPVENRKLYLAASIIMGVAGIFMLFSREFVSASAMIVAAGLAADHYRLLGKCPKFPE